MVLQKNLVQQILLGALLLSLPAFAKETAKEAKEKTLKEKNLIRYIGREHRDPTANPLLSLPSPKTKLEEVVRLPSLQIQGIIWGGSSPQAIINEQVVAKGDVIAGGVEILDISKGGIKVIYRSKIFTLLPKGAVEEK